MKGRHRVKEEEIDRTVHEQKKLQKKRTKETWQLKKAQIKQFWHQLYNPYKCIRFQLHFIFMFNKKVTESLVLKPNFVNVPSGVNAGVDTSLILLSSV